jgi:hypothetical protein
MKNIFKYIILEQLLTENRIQQAKDKYPCLPPKFIDYLSAGDSSGNNKYLEWMCKNAWDSEGVNEITGMEWASNTSTIYQWLEDNHDYPDEKGDPTKPPICQNILANEFSSRVKKTNFDNIEVKYFLKDLADALIEEVKYFHRFVNALPIKDINRYNYNTLKDALSNKKLQSQEKELAKDVTKIYEDNEWLFVSPKTHQSSCAYGANTKWCVTMRGDNSYFKNYTDNGEYLIFVISKAANRKWAIHTKIPMGSEPQDVNINLPWHKEVKLFYGYVDKPAERFPRNPRGGLSALYKGGSKTTYWNAEDDEINWDEFIKESNLPEKLQQLLRFVEKKVVVSIAKKKKGDIPYEKNENPVRLRKGDKVKLLASGYGYIRGDEGYVIATWFGSGTKGTKLPQDDAGVYTVYVPKRIRQYRDYTSDFYKAYNTIDLKKTDKLLPKLNLGPDDDFETGNQTITLTGVNINGVFLQKIR